jgi:aerobic carbon-monoxide dehydrogenase medium subunit
VIPRFSFVRPRSLEAAFAAFDVADGDAAWIAGGTELLQVMKMGLAQFSTLIDLKHIDGLRGVEASPDGGLRIGATTTHRELERDASVRERLPGLAALETGVANVRVRNTGTIGGNLAFAEPHSDPATFLLACGATVTLVSPRGRRTLPIGEFVLGPLFTAREADEILVAIDVPPVPDGGGRAYEKIAFFERPAASVAVEVTVRDGAVAAASVAVGSLTEVPELVPDAAAALIGLQARTEAPTDLGSRAAGSFASLDAVPDLNGSADYKRHLATVLFARAATRALTEATARV